MRMRRGTTDWIWIEIPFKTAHIADGWVTITQLGNVIRDYRITEPPVVLRDGSIYIPLTQEDTLAFPTGAIQLQARIRLMNGAVASSDAMYATVDDVDKDGVI